MIDRLSAVFLLLGPACNMTCRHCSQKPIKNTFSLRPDSELDDRIVTFIKDWLKAKNGSRSAIIFWGGEPLLYWETIKKCILLFESKGISPNYYNVYSNGLLLTDDVTEFCNQHNILFTLSYDAPNPLAVRNNIPSADNIRAFLKIRKRIVNFVFSAPNDNPTAGYRMLEELFPETIVTMGVINVFSDIPKDIYTFRPGQIEKAIDDLADDIIAGNDPYGNRYNFFVNRFIAEDTFNREWFDKAPFPPCAPGRTSISFKFNGDVVLCHNDNRVIASVGDSYTEMMDKHLRYWEGFLPDVCKTCAVLPMCRNRCPIGMFTADKTEYVHCNVLRRFYGSVMRNRKKLTECDIKDYIHLRERLRNGDV